MKKNNDRRNFLKKLAAAGAATALTPIVLKGEAGKQVHSKTLVRKSSSATANNNIQIALIGAGGMGVADAKTALSHKEIKLVAVADLYDTNLTQAKQLFGKEIFTSRDYREILKRDDIDAVIIATHDHWHQQISVDALNAGKHVYCEKPMVHSIQEGPAIIKAQKSSGKVYQVGSQLLSSLGYEKAKELLNLGAIGTLNYAEGVWSRRSSGGAWNSVIPDDASEKTIDWETFLRNYKKIPFSAERFFNWRKYLDYGTGMNGDLFVHIISGLHFVTDSFGPSKIYSSGGIRFWNDGREVPDVLVGTFDYDKAKTHPGFNLSLRCNFVDGNKGSYYYVMRLIGSEGMMEVFSDKVTLYRNKVLSGTDPVRVVDKINNVEERKKILGPEVIVYETEKGYKGGHYDHFGYWFNAIRNNKNIVEDAIFGFRAAAPAVLCMESHLQEKVVRWDPVLMKKIS